MSLIAGVHRLLTSGGQLREIEDVWSAGGQSLVSLKVGGAGVWVFMPEDLVLMVLPNRSCLVNSTCPPMQRTDLPYPSALVMAEDPTVGGLGGGLVLSWPSVEVLRDCFMIHNPQIPKKA